MPSKACTFHLCILFFTYCRHVWGNAYDTNLYPLVVLQKRLIRIITFSKYLYHTGPLFKELGFLKIGEINKYLFGKFMYRWYDIQVPLLFLDMFQYVKIIHGYVTRQTDQLYIPKVKTNLGKCSLKYKGPVIWNSILSAHINPDTSEAVFAKTLKHCIVIGLIWSHIISNLLFVLWYTETIISDTTRAHKGSIFYVCTWVCLVVEVYICTHVRWETSVHVWGYSCFYGLLCSLYFEAYPIFSFSMVMLFKSDFVTFVIISCLLVLKHSWHRCALIKYVNILQMRQTRSP